MRPKRPELSKRKRRPLRWIFRRCRQGDARAQVWAPYRTLGRFLEGDIQDDLAFTREVLRAVEDVRKGVKPRWSVTVNSHTLTLEVSGAVIENDFEADQPPCRIDLPRLARALAAWLDFLEARDAG